MSVNARQTALYELRRRIISGELQGGDKLRASHLAEDMVISRTPISEALLKLEAEGLLIGDKSGFTVRSFSVQEVFDAIDLRGLLEAAAAERAAEIGATEDHLQRLKDLLDEMDGILEDKNLDAYETLNETFHVAVLHASRSPILIEEAMRSYRLPFAGPSAFPIKETDHNRFHSSILTGQEHHRLIVEAIEARQSARVFSLMREHARVAHGNVEAALNARHATPQLALVKDA
ncbi:MAG: GntR family transcriptional regulator [Pseudomonadota bacterium]